MARKKKDPFIDAAKGSLAMAIIYLWQNDEEFRTIVFDLLKSLKEKSTEK